MYVDNNRSRAYRIPVRVVDASESTVAPGSDTRAAGASRPEPSGAPSAVQPEDTTAAPPEQAGSTPFGDASGTPSEPVPAEEVTPTGLEQEVDWRVQALRLQAEMDGFRKRQTQRAEAAIAAERERLLRLMLSVADNLTRVLNHSRPGDPALWHGVDLTHRELMRQLQAEGVRPIQAVGQPFDPQWHEALAVRPARAPSGTVIEEVETGYQLNGKLLRPARVVVAA